MLCRPELTATLAKAIARLPPASLDEWFRCAGTPIYDGRGVKYGDLVVVPFVSQTYNVVKGTVAMAVSIVDCYHYANVMLDRKLDGESFAGHFSRFPILAWPGEPLGFTLLHAAAALKCSAPVVSALLEGQSAATTDVLGRTPLDVAVVVKEGVGGL